jgi:hypothetical protein
MQLLGHVQAGSTASSGAVQQELRDSQEVDVLIGSATAALQGSLDGRAGGLCMTRFVRIC